MAINWARAKGLIRTECKAERRPKHLFDNDESSGLLAQHEPRVRALGFEEVVIQLAEKFEEQKILVGIFLARGVVQDPSPLTSIAVKPTYPPSQTPQHPARTFRVISTWAQRD